MKSSGDLTLLFNVNKSLYLNIQPSLWRTHTHTELRELSEHDGKNVGLSLFQLFCWQQHFSEKTRPVDLNMHMQVWWFPVKYQYEVYIHVSDDTELEGRNLYNSICRFKFHCDLGLSKCSRSADYKCVYVTYLRFWLHLCAIKKSQRFGEDYPDGGATEQNVDNLHYTFCLFRKSPCADSVLVQTVLCWTRWHWGACHAQLKPKVITCILIQVIISS